MIASDTQVTVGQSGLESLVWQEREFVSPAPLTVIAAKFTGFQGPENPGKLLETVAAGQSIRKSYERLDVQCDFLPGKHRLDIVLTVTNKTDHALESATISIGELLLSADLLNTGSDLVNVLGDMAGIIPIRDKPDTKYAPV